MGQKDEQNRVPRRKARSGRPPKGVGRPKNRYRSFKECRKYAHKLCLLTMDEWMEHTGTEGFPEDVPFRPDRSYEKEWQGWVDFLGSGYVSLERAKELVRHYGIGSKEEFRERHGELFVRPPELVPAMPERYYEGWSGWLDFTGASRKKPDRDKSTYVHWQLTPFKKGTHYRPFMEAVKFVSKLGLRDHVEWLRWRSKYPHKDLPWRPDEVYDKEWRGWSIWLGHDPLPGLLDNVAVLFLGQHIGDPSNVYRLEVHAMGKSDLMYRAEREGFRVLRVWRYDYELRDDVRNAIDKNCSKYYGSDQMYIVPNVFGLYSDLFSLLPVIV